MSEVRARSTGLAACVLALALVGCGSGVEGRADGHDVGSTFGDAVTSLHGTVPWPDQPWRGDFDGDGELDLLAIVRLGNPTAALLAPRLRYPFEWGSPSRPEEALAASLGLAIVHAEGTAVLLVDSRRHSILATTTAPELSVLSAGARAQVLQELALEGAQGDLVRLPTEAGIDTYLYWDGQDYRFHEPLESP